MNPQLSPHHRQKQAIGRANAHPCPPKSLTRACHAYSSECSRKYCAVMDDKTLTVLEAAQLTGKARSTITRNITAGKLPNSQKRDDGSYTVQLHDLIQAGLVDTVRAKEDARESELAELKQRNQQLNLELKHARATIEDLQERISDLRDTIDALKTVRTLIDSNTKALESLSDNLRPKAIEPTSPTPSEAQTPSEPSSDPSPSESSPTSSPKTGFFGRFFNKN